MAKICLGVNIASIFQFFWRGVGGWVLPLDPSYTRKIQLLQYNLLKWGGNSRNPYPAQRGFHDKSEIKKKKPTSNRLWMDSECIICIRFSKKKKNREDPPLPHATGKNSPASRISEIGALKAKITHNFGGKNQQAIGKNGLRTHHLHPFFTNFLGETPTPPPPPPHDNDKTIPLFGFIDPLQLRWKFFRITYRRSELWRQELHTKFWEKINTLAKMGSDCTSCFRFSKIFSGGGGGGGFIWSSKAKVKILPHHVQCISKIGALKAKIAHKFFGKKSTRTRQKMGSECTICVHFSKVFPGEAPRTPTCGRGYPPPALSPCGASRRFGYAPRQWTLWIRHCA